MLNNMYNNLILGIGGLLTLMVIAFIDPSVRESFHFTNISALELIVLLATILSIIGFFGFLPKDIQSYKNRTINILRIVFIVFFIVDSYLF